MRKNLPVTLNEVIIPEDHYLISKTNLEGVIYYINPIFERVSGFTRADLIGSDHNIVRHPDMPPAVFQDMWKTLKDKKPWEGVVKNRRKDGGFYWVYARSVPIIEEGVHTGYASVRVKASREQIENAKSAYKEMDPSLTQLATRSWFKRLCTPFTALFSNSYRSHFLRYGVLNVAASLLVFFAIYLKGKDVGVSMWVIYSLLAFFIGLIMVDGRRFTNQLLHVLKESTYIAQQVSTGNLRVHIAKDPSAPLESRQLYFYLDFMRRNLTVIALDAKHGVSSSLEAAETLQESSHALSTQTVEQLTALQLSTESIERLTSAVDVNFSYAEQASYLAQASQEAATKGRVDVSELINLMQAIHQHSRQITEITTLIESIAFQTNILALNAAVEAARAGEKGDGFAVVANEVRNLALRSSAATRDIKDLTDASVDRIKAGLVQAELAGESMIHIATEVESVAKTIALIADSSEEQREGLKRTTEAISQLSHLSHKNSQIVDTVGEIADEINAEAVELSYAIAILSVLETTQRNR